VTRKLQLEWQKAKPKWFFFKDPLASHAHEVDINMLLRVCDVHNVPIATNEATAQLLLKAIELQS
jgi:methylglyoxal synthase